MEGGKKSSMDFPKSERLCKKNDVEHLFSKGASFFQYPFKVIYTYRLQENPLESSESVEKVEQNQTKTNGLNLVLDDPQSNNPIDLPKVLIVVGKKKFKKAVDRNRIKRKIREAYRLNRKKKLILTTNEKPILFLVNLGLVYTANTDLPFQQIQKGVVNLLERLNNIQFGAEEIKKGDK